MKRKLEKQTQSGITLIALVITIIVLIILAGITINLLFTDNGIINQALTAKNRTEQKQQEESNQMEQLNDFLENQNQKIISLYCWNYETINFATLKAQVEYLKINTIYVQEVSNMFKTNQFEKIANFCKLYNINLYILNGESKWYNNTQRIQEMIDEVYNYNQTANYKIKGINLDIEFYHTDEYKNVSSKEEEITIINEFVQTLKTCSTYAKNKELEYVTCIPTWLDESILEEVMKSNCSILEIMNYVKKDNIANIEKEVELAKKYGKKIVSIAELQSTEEYSGLLEEETFYQDGIKECNNQFKLIENHYQYFKLGRGYHHYKPLEKLIQEVTDINNRYECEVYSYYDGKSIEIQNAYAVFGNEKIQGIPSHYESAKEYIITFPGLEYGKEYQMVIQDVPYYVNSKIVGQKVEGEDVKYISFDLTKEPVYTMEIYGYTEKYEEAVSLTGGKLKCEGEEIVAELMDINGISILVFENVRYNKEYTLEIDNTDYEIVKGTYIRTDTNINYYGDDVILRKKN